MDKVSPQSRGALIIKAVDDPNAYRLDLDAIERGLQAMAEKFPKHFADILGENDDAITSDVLLQCCLFGYVIYG